MIADMTLQELNEELKKENKQLKKMCFSLKQKLIEIEITARNNSLKSENEKLVTNNERDILMQKLTEITAQNNSLKAENEKLVKKNEQDIMERKATLDLTDKTRSLLSLVHRFQVETMAALVKRKTLLDKNDSKYKMMMENIGEALKERLVAVAKEKEEFKMEQLAIKSIRLSKKVLETGFLWWP